LPSKVLPEAFAQDGERLFRFEREKKLLARCVASDRGTSLVEKIRSIDWSDSGKGVRLEVHRPRLLLACRFSLFGLRETRRLAADLSDPGTWCGRRRDVPFTALKRSFKAPLTIV
jgi:hypothetical protein